MIQKNNIIVFLGDSQFEYCNWNELLVRSDMLNYGIAGDTTSGLVGRVEVVCQHNPSKIFIEIGTNDLSLGDDVFPEDDVDVDVFLGGIVAFIYV